MPQQLPRWNRHLRHQRRPARALRLGWLAGLLSGAGLACAQPVNNAVEYLDFRRPEAWAMAYVGAAMLPSGWSLRPQGSGWSAALELNEVPHLSQRQRRVGFDGIKLEDLNRSPVFGRAWLGYALPWGWSVQAGWTPPIRIKGAKASELWSLVLARRFEHGPWRYGVAVHGGSARIGGSFTCYDAIIGTGPGDCAEPSDDEYRHSYYGAEGGLGYAGDRWRVQPELTFAMHRLDAETQVRARFASFEDRTLLITDGHLRSFGLGLRFDLTARISARLALTHTPLKVKRRDRDRAESDDLTQLRLSLYLD